MEPLKDIAERVKAEADAKRAAESTDVITEEAAPETDAILQEEPVEETDDAEDDGMIMGIEPDDIPGDSGETIITGNEEEDLKALLNEDREKLGITKVGTAASTTIVEWEGKLREAFKEIHIPADVADIEFANILNILSHRRKSLIVDEALDDIELEEAMTKRFNREIDALKAKYTGKGSVTVIEVPETTADKIEFTEEQQRKLEKSSRIQLVKVEKKELGTIKVKNLSKAETKLKYTQAMNTEFISKYSVPLPLTGDFGTFRGALMVELLQARAENDELLQSIVAKKASLAYKHFVEGVNNKIKDEKGTTIMTYADFINTYRYNDLDLMVYAVICASSGPLTVSDLKCSKCGHSFQKSFNVASLLDMTHTPQNIQDIFKKIINNQGQLKVMENLKDEMNELVRGESPMTKNIYDIGAPTIARAIELLNEVDQDDPTDVYIVAIALFIHGLYVYDKTDDDYIPFEQNEYKEIIGALKMLPQSELTMLHDMTVDILYNPAFTMTSKCPECATDLVNNIPINDLVFFVAPETPVEMKR